MRVLVTGATGFLGGVVARELAASGHEVWGVGRDPVRGQALQQSGVRFVPLDLRGAVFSSLIAEAHAVVHSAARSTLWGRWADFYADNVEVSAAVARACAGAGVRLVHISTPSVYNATGQTQNISESTAIGPHFDSLYAHSKYLAELEVQAAHPEATILRPRGIYGPGDTSILPRLALALRAGRLPRLDGANADGGGEVHTELTHVRNVSHAVALALARPAPGLFNITDGVTIPIWATLDRLADALSVPRPTRQANPRTLETVARVLERLYALHPRRPEPPLTASGVRLLTRGMTLDLTRARERLGYVPVVHPDQGLEEAIQAAVNV
ncbi:NAD(P)-dependent oxidoreductase [Deinococcus sp. Arct2-2]|uniref:NAD-dependent epimerase/dehydratase family protein n=1 Tax=Deinococcus sp. Arct2-2 TaxID=2568653 RepID=UPI0010A52B36|nr:NAD(P)-dependent oxidoreductase [Deinococcus sp. Arct2-2]THF69016.1 NAD(P)-dependent oxidoreductase [Deinococcus sp. Arct2-2]